MKFVKISSKKGTEWIPSSSLIGFFTKNDQVYITYHSPINPTESGMTQHYVNRRLLNVSVPELEAWIKASQEQMIWAIDAD